mmetsp:Transcript_2497/g.5730  ORF Transcript_2497/g.5730 Transcript_2497/m.5730 type:complete len:108 (+) Transcript_2497:46-369(+)
MLFSSREDDPTFLGCRHFCVIRANSRTLIHMMLSLLSDRSMSLDVTSNGDRLVHSSHQCRRPLQTHREHAVMVPDREAHRSNDVKRDTHSKNISLTSPYGATVGPTK